MKIYIAGPMTGRLGHNFDNFDRSRDSLKENGYEPVSPADLSRAAYPGFDFSTGKMPNGFNYGKMLLLDLAELEKCDAIFMLDDWDTSRGARLERDFASMTNKAVYYEDGGLLP